MDLQRWMALGAVAVNFSKASAFADDTIVKALKYRDNIASAVAIVDDQAELILLGYQVSVDSNSSFFLENASGGTGAGSDAKTILPKQFIAANTTSPLVECYLPFGLGKPIMIGGSNGGNFSITVYVMDKAYLNRARWAFNT